MKLKRLFSLTMAMMLFIIAPITVKAESSHVPYYTPWNVLILVLPNSAVENYVHGERLITTMHYPEIQKINELANKINDDYERDYFRINVSVKTDYEALKTLSYEGISWNGVKPQNVASQLAKNSTLNQYDSILVVYRDVDNANNANFFTNAWTEGRNVTSKDATYATYALSDGDHKMPALNATNGEINLLVPLLQSVYKEVSKTNTTVKDPSTVYDLNDPVKAKAQLKEYINGLDGGMYSVWGRFHKTSF